MTPDLYDSTVEYNCLVKFTKLEYIDTIIDNKIKAGFPHEFNDPFDSRLHIAEARARTLAQSLQVPFDLIEYHMELLSYIQITSLIRQDPFSYESNLMWAHYADSGRNMAVLYDFKEVKQRWPGTLTEVKYQDNYADTESLMEEYIKYMIKHELASQKIYEDALIKFYTHKHIHWSYEKEYRIVTFGFASTIKSIGEMSLGKIDYMVLKKYFKMRTLSVQSFYEISRLFSRVSNTGLSDLKTSGYVGLLGVNEHQVIEMPHYDTLFISMPKPKEIILGWNVEARKELKIKDICLSSSIKLSKACIPTGINSNSNSYHKEVIYNP